MKTRLILALGLVVTWMAGLRASGQKAVELDIGVYAGLTITGEVGIVYSIEYVSDLAQTNDASRWRCLEFLQLPTSPYLWVDKSGSAAGRRFYRAVEFPAPTNMVFIPPGTFWLGSSSNEAGRQPVEGPQTAVTISRALWMGKHEVTQGEYLAVMTNNPSSHSNDTNLPVELVSWNDATNYCGALTQLARAGGSIPTNCMYRLPTEAEWEHACRAETSTRFSYGEDPGNTNLTSYAWFDLSAGGESHLVGQKLPNPWGLHDMHGNVSEWCLDTYALSYPGGISVDPVHLEPTIFGHVVRGGDFSRTADQCRSAMRLSGGGPGGFQWVGFRVVLVSSSPN